MHTPFHIDYVPFGNVIMIIVEKGVLEKFEFILFQREVVH